MKKYFLNLTLTIFMTVNFSVGSAKADALTGNEIYKFCSNEQIDITEAFCLGYTAALVEGLAWGSSLALTKTKIVSDASKLNEINGTILGYCIPRTVNNNQIKDTFIKYLVDNPSIRHETARYLFTLSMQKSFPC